MSTYTDTLITRVPQTCRWRVRCTNGCPAAWLARKGVA